MARRLMQLKDEREEGGITAFRPELHGYLWWVEEINPDPNYELKIYDTWSLATGWHLETWLNEYGVRIYLNEREETNP